MLKRLLSPKKSGRQTEKKNTAKPSRKAAASAKVREHRRERMETPKPPRGTFDALFLYDLMQKEYPDREVDPSAAVFLEGVLNYLGTEIVELSYNRAKGRSNGRSCMIMPEDIKAAVENDEDLKDIVQLEDPSKMRIKKKSSEGIPMIVEVEHDENEEEIVYEMQE